MTRRGGSIPGIVPPFSFNLQYINQVKIKTPQNILFFVKSGLASDKDQTAATELAAKTGKRVVFRNATVAKVTNEKPEPCIGVAGLVPDAYAAAFPVYALDGTVTQPEGGADIVDMPKPELNALGLPKGCPEDRDALKEALTMAKVEFHPNMKTDKLIDLFRAAVLEAQGDETPEA